MSKKIYENKSAADAAKRFRMLCEYSFNITEDDGEEAPEMEEPEMGAPGGDDMGNPTPEMGGNDDMQDMSQMDGAPEMDGANPQEGGAPGFNPEESAGSDETNDVDLDNMEDGDEVIDIDELTQSQEDTEEKVDDVHVTMEKGFDKLLSVVSKLDKMIDASTANMEQIKQEIEKRNPTPLEKLNMRAANDSYPFNVSPSDYWKSKEASSNYRIGGDDDNNTEEYTITQGDIDNISDFRAISKDLDDSEFNQNLLNIFGLK